MRDLAAKALALWEVRPADVTLAAQRENVVFRVTAERAVTYALRFHRRGYRTDAEIRSELRWMSALAAGGLSVPSPIASRGGNYTEWAGGHQVDLLTWLPGVPMGNVNEPLTIPDRPGTFFGLGREMARLHEIADSWVIPDGFSRPSWSIDGLVGPAPLWGPFWENPGLSKAERSLLIAARDAARDVLEAPSPRLEYGLVHADLVRENVLVDFGCIRFIDFDDSGFGYRLFDIATALLKNRSEPDYAELEAALLDGYRSIRTLDAARLGLFMMLRAFTYLGWIIPRLDEPGATARNARNIAAALPLARHYLG